MRVGQVMKKDVRVINEEKTVREAARLMHEVDCGAIPVESEDRLVGMLTDRDIALRLVAEGRDPSSERVKNFMSKGIRYCFENDDLQKATDLMIENRLRRLPVLNRDKRLVGILSLDDIAKGSEEEHLVHNTLRRLQH